jgi:hypothetical protein
MTTPDFMVIGAQKCATSWLDYHLRQHPQILLPAEKDVEFFSYTANLNLEISKAWLKRFEGAQTGQRIGDVNGAYFWTETGSPWSVKLDSFNRRIPEAIRGFLGDRMQFIVSLRNPVERAVSAYLHHITYSGISPNSRIMEIDEPLGIVDMGFFGAHLQNWLQVYPASRFLVLAALPSSQDAAASLMSGILRFLGVDAFPADHDFERKVFPGMQRLKLEGGVWVPESHSAIAAHLPLQRKVPVITENGSRYLRLVTSEELEQLKKLFEADQALLAGLLKTEGMTVLETRGAPSGESAT